MFAEDVGSAPQPHVHPHVGTGAPAASGVRRPGPRPVRGNGLGRARRFRARGVVQWRPVRRRPRPAPGTDRDRDHAGRGGPRLGGDRSVAARHAVRARARSGQAGATRCALHRPRQDHADRGAGHRPSVGGGVGDGQGRHRRGHETRGRGPVQSHAHAPARAGRAAVARFPRRVARVHRTRSGLRLGQFSVSRPARAQGPGTPRAGRGRGARLSAHVPGRRPGQRQGHRGQRLRR